MPTGTGDGSAEKIALEIEKMFLEIRQGLTLGDVVGEFVEVTEPVFPVLPVGEADLWHRSFYGMDGEFSRVVGGKWKAGSGKIWGQRSKKLGSEVGKIRISKCRSSISHLRSPKAPPIS